MVRERTRNSRIADLSLNCIYAPMLFVEFELGEHRVIPFRPSADTVPAPGAVTVEISPMRVPGSSAEAVESLLVLLCRREHFSAEIIKYERVGTAPKVAARSRSKHPSRGSSDPILFCTMPGLPGARVRSSSGAPPRFAAVAALSSEP